MFRVMGAAVVAMVCFWAAPASAVTVDLTCDVQFQVNRLENGVLREESSVPNSYQFSIDTDRRTLTTGTTVAPAVIDATEVVSMSEMSPTITMAWVINRTTGQIYSMVVSRGDIRSSLINISGQCRKADGTTSF